MGGLIQPVKDSMISLIWGTILARVYWRADAAGAAIDAYKPAIACAMRFYTGRVTKHTV